MDNTNLLNFKILQLESTSLIEKIPTLGTYEGIPPLKEYRKLSTFVKMETWVK